jgi:hypothetical protein
MKKRLDIDLEKWVVYTEEGTDNFIAVTREENKKIFNLVSKHQHRTEIPDEETVLGTRLMHDSVQQCYRLGGFMESKYPVKILTPTLIELIPEKNEKKTTNSSTGKQKFR